MSVECSKLESFTSGAAIVRILPWPHQSWQPNGLGSPKVLATRLSRQPDCLGNPTLSATQHSRQPNTLANPTLLPTLSPGNQTLSAATSRALPPSTNARFIGEHKIGVKLGGAVWNSGCATNTSTIHKSERGNMILSATDVRQLGLKLVKLTENDQEGLGERTCREMFESTYGSPPEVCAQLWQDLCNTDLPNALVPLSERNLKGFRLFMMAQFELWVYPKNRRLIQVLFYPVGEKDTYGQNIWKWVGRVCALLPTKIKWHDRFDNPDAEVFVVTVDGVDCRSWEKRDHPTMPFDKKAHSHKFAHSAWKYEIAVAIYSDHIVWVNGPFKGGKHDLTILREGQEDGSGSLLEMIPMGKFIVADRGYKTGEEHEMSKIAFKRNEDPIVLKRFKACATCRHKMVNSRIKQFNSLTETFRHGKEKHELAFKAVCVIVQYHLDMGAAILYDV